LASDADRGKLTREQTFRHQPPDRDIRLYQAQFRNDRIMRAETFEQPNQDQLRVRIGIDPQINRIEPIADIGQAERRERGERFRQIGVRQQRSGIEAVTDTDHLVGDPGCLETSRTGVARRQDQPLHFVHRFTGAIKTGS